MSHSPAYELLATMPKGTVIYTVVRHRAPSGMSRVIDAFVIPRPGHPRFLRSLVNEHQFPFALDPKHDGFRMKGLGFDTPRYLVREIGKLVHGDQNWFQEMGI